MEGTLLPQEVLVRVTRKACDGIYVTLLYGQLVKLICTFVRLLQHNHVETEEFSERDGDLRLQ